MAGPLGGLGDGPWIVVPMKGCVQSPGLLKPATASADASAMIRVSQTGQGQRSQDEAQRPPLRLLIVEDDPDTRFLLEAALVQHFGERTVHAVDGVGRALELDPTQFDLVLTDMNLPDGTGLDLLQALLKRRPDLPVIMVTGESVTDLALTAIRTGAYDYLTKSGDYLFALPVVVEKNLALWRIKQENERLHRELHTTLEQLRQKNAQLEELVDKLQAMALTDPLTGLANRRAFKMALDRSFAECSRYGQDLACIMIDLDGFKQFNDALGHQRGDELLQLAGQVLLHNCRRCDVAARFGGDEFVLLLPQTDLPMARACARRIAEEFPTALAPLSAIASGLRPVTMSMGLACLRHSSPATPEQMIAHADQALYLAKQAGKTCLKHYSPAPPTAPAQVIASPGV